MSAWRLTRVLGNSVALKESRPRAARATRKLPPQFPRKGQTRPLSPLAPRPRSPGSTPDAALAARDSGSGSSRPAGSLWLYRRPRLAGLQLPDAQGRLRSGGRRGRWAGPGRRSAAVSDSRSPPAASVCLPDPTGDPSMVRASTVGAHLPASGLDIFGDLRKMNKRQVRTARVGVAPRSRGPGGPGGGPPHRAASRRALAPRRARLAERGWPGGERRGPRVRALVLTVARLAERGAGGEGRGALTCGRQMWLRKRGWGSGLSREGPRGAARWARGRASLRGSRGRAWGRLPAGGSGRLGGSASERGEPSPDSSPPQHSVSPSRGLRTK